MRDSVSLKRVHERNMFGSIGRQKSAERSKARLSDSAGANSYRYHTKRNLQATPKPKKNVNVTKAIGGGED